MLTVEDKRHIHEALTKCQGNRAQAAALLGITKQELKNRIYNNKDLRAAWVTPQVAGPSHADVTDGPDLSVTAPEIVESWEQRMAREDAEYSKLMESVGVDPGDVTEAMSLEKFFGRFIGRSLNVIGGGVTVRALKLMKFLEGLDENFKKGFTGENARTELATWTFAYMEGHKHLSRMLEVANMSATARAKIELYRSQANASRGKGKAGFGPKTVSIESGVPS